MFKLAFASFTSMLMLLSGQGNVQKVWCTLPSGKVVYTTPSNCLKRGGTIVQPTPTSTPTPTPTPIQSGPTATPTPTPTITPTPTPTPQPQMTITNLVTHLCTSGTSCYGVTGVEVFGTNFTQNSRTKLVLGDTTYNGSYMGGDGSTRIVADFVGLPHCSFFDAVVFNPAPDTRTVTAFSSVSSVCP